MSKRPARVPFLRTVSRASFLLLLIMGAWHPSLQAQTADSATVLGRVTDPSGGVVPDAQVRLTNDATQVAREQVSNGEGLYTFTNMKPGTYTLTATKTGFETVKINGLQLEVAKSYTVNASLEMGATAQVVVVHAEAAVELQTTDATVGNVISGATLSHLPTLTRDATELLSLQPGSMPAPPANDGLNTNGGQVAGGRPDQNTEMLDGIDVTQPGGGPSGAGVIPLSVENVQEFRVGVTNPNATFGRGSGGQVSLTSRSGTNGFHGDAYWYDQNTAFNANAWENNHAQPKPLPRPVVHDNRGGFTLGGPLRKDKTFFFGSYEVRRFPQQLASVRYVPSDTLKGLNPLYPNGAVTYNGTTYDLKTLDPRHIGLSPAVKALWATMPSGNDPGDPGSDGSNVLAYRGTAGTRRADNSYTLKLDHNIGTSLRSFVRYSYGDIALPGNQVDLRGSTGSHLNVVDGSKEIDDSFIAGLDWTVRNNLLNSFRFGYVRQRQNQFILKPADVAAQLAIPGSQAVGSSFAPGSYVTLVASNWGGQNCQSGCLNLPVDAYGGAASPIPASLSRNPSLQFADNLNWIKGKHNMVFGVDVRRLPAYSLDGDNFPAAVMDSTAFGTPGGLNVSSYNPVPGKPDGFNRLFAGALGIVDSTQIPVTRSASFQPVTPVGQSRVTGGMQRAYYFFAQDTWRLKPSLTFSYGLGYGWQAPPSEADGKFAILIDAASGKPFDPMQYLANKKAAALQGQVYNPQFGYAPYKSLGLPGAWHTDYTDWAPRASLAWSPSATTGLMGRLFGDQKTVIRGGYGIVYDRTNASNINVANGAGSLYVQSLGLTLPKCNASGTPGTGCNAAGDQVQSGFRVGVDGAIPFNLPDVARSVPYVPTGGDFLITATDTNFKEGRANLLDLSIQRQLTSNVSLELGYIGRLGRRLQNAVTLNQLPYMYKDVTAVAPPNAGKPGSGQTFAQAFDAIAIFVRNPANNGLPVPVQSWIEDQVPNTCSTGTSTACLVSAVGAGTFALGGLNSIFGYVDGARQGAGIPVINSQQQVDLQDRVSNDSANYNALEVTLRDKGWHGLMFDLNYTLSKSLDHEARVQGFVNGYDDGFNIRGSYGPCFCDRTHVFNAIFSYDLPFGNGHRLGSKNAILDQVIGGWYVTGIFRAMSGIPVVVAESAFGRGGGFVTSNNIDEIPLSGAGGFQTGLHRNSSGSAAACLGGTTAGGNASVSNQGNGINYFADPGAAYCNFRPVLLSQDGGTGRGNPLRGFGFWNQDLSIGKTTTIKERIGLQFSVDLYNAFNHVNYQDPGAGSAQFIDAGNVGGFGTIPDAQFIPANRTWGSRWVQMGVRVTF